MHWYYRQPCCPWPMSSSACFARLTSRPTFSTSTASGLLTGTVGAANIEPHTPRFLLKVYALHFWMTAHFRCSVKVVNSSSNCKSKCELAHWMHAGWKCHGQRWLPAPAAQSTAAASFSLTSPKKCWRSQAWATGHTCLNVRAKLPALTKSACLHPFSRTCRPSNACLSCGP